MNSIDTPIEVNTMVLVTLSEHGATLSINHGEKFMLQCLEWDPKRRNLVLSDCAFSNMVFKNTSINFGLDIRSLIFTLSKLIWSAKELADKEKAGEMVEPL